MEESWFFETIFCSMIDLCGNTFNHNCYRFNCDCIQLCVCQAQCAYMKETPFLSLPVCVFVKIQFLSLSSVVCSAFVLFRLEIFHFSLFSSLNCFTISLRDLRLLPGEHSCLWKIYRFCQQIE